MMINCHTKLAIVTAKIFLIHETLQNDRTLYKYYSKVQVYLLAQLQLTISTTSSSLPYVHMFHTVREDGPVYLITSVIMGLCVIKSFFFFSF